MIKEKVQALIDQVFQLTESGDLIWSTTSSSKWSRMLKSTGEDGTKYELEVKWILSNEKFTLDNSYLFVRNDNLPNGLYCCNYMVNDIKPLRDLLLERYCQDLNPTAEEICDTFDKMRIGMNKELWRDTQIKNVIDDEKM